jgi:RNA polymerase sigma-70 factor (ECF subfamily)
MSDQPPLDPADAQRATDVIRTHGPAVLRYLRAVLRDDDVADDAFSLFAEWVWASIGRFRGESPVKTWAFGIGWNAARRVRDEAWQKKRERLPTGAASVLAEAVRSSTSVERDQLADRLAELRRDLSPEDQNLLVLRVDQRLDWAEIADILAAGGEAVQPAALRKRFERMKERIGRLAREKGLLS